MTVSTPRPRAILRAAALAILALPHFADAGTKTWVGGNALWSNNAGWSPVNAPVAGDNALLSGAFTCALTSTATVSGIGSLDISQGMTLTESSGIFSMTKALTVGAFGAGTYNLNGGRMYAGSLNIGSVSSGTMNLTAGTFNATAVTMPFPPSNAS